ncbi:MAG TPA: response regulator [Myxococcaceae bacterium]|nr:response regulator [Myxococcaceae bacterium]
MSIDLQRVVRVFAEEAEVLAQKITRALLTLESAEAGGAEFREALAELARQLHTLKGSAATVSLDGVCALAHLMEDAALTLDPAARVPFQTSDALLAALDAAMGSIRSQAEGRPESAAALAEASARFGTDAPLPLPTLPSAPRADGATGWRVDAQDVTALAREIERLREIHLRLEERHRELDRAINALSRLGLLAETAEARARVMGVGGALARDAENTLDVVQALEERVKGICTLPVGTVLEPLHRAVRDLCRATGKEARVSVSGGEVSLDRRLLEALKGPLVHLVRNAVDHGLEGPEVREARGKHREGALWVRVEKQGNVVFIEVADDGGGLDLHRIRQVAERRGWASPSALRAMDPEALYALIFRTGFSTAETATSISGRGVGLDVVKREVEALQGTVEVQSKPGDGTRFVLTLPTELGSSPVLLVRVGEHHFGIPALAVEAVAATRTERLHTTPTRTTLEHDGRLLPVRNLGALLGLCLDEPPEAGQPLLLLQAQGERTALVVDEVLGDRELTIRQLPEELRSLPAYQGGCTLARGELLLVLRPDFLVTQALRERTASTAKRALVVDDALTARALHRAVLEAGGYAVHSAGSGEQGLSRLQRTTYDVVVCDVAMEGMNGLEFTRHVRSKSEWAQVPVVLVSAHDGAEDRERGEVAGADGFLSKKDCASGRLLAEVARAAARRRPRS